MLQGSNLYFVCSCWWVPKSNLIGLSLWELKFWGHRINTILARQRKLLRLVSKPLNYSVVYSPKHTRWIRELNYYHSYTLCSFALFFFFSGLAKKLERPAWVGTVLATSEPEAHCVAFPVVSTLCGVLRELLSGLNWATAYLNLFR